MLTLKIKPATRDGRVSGFSASFYDTEGDMVTFITSDDHKTIESFINRINELLEA